MKKKDLVLSNSNIATRKNLTLEPFFEFNFNAKDFGIKNQTSISNDLKIKYLIYNDVLKKNQVCTRCHKIPGHHHVGLQTLKILNVYDGAGYVQIDFNDPQEIDFLNGIIKAMRKNFFHGKNVCSLPSCDVDEEFKSLMEEEEAMGGLRDVDEMYRTQERNETRF